MTQWGLDTIFNPAKRHMDEEKRRLQSTREEVGDNSGGKRIDLESGKVSIRGAAADDEDENDATDSGRPAKDDRAAKDSGKASRGIMRAPGRATGTGKSGKVAEPSAAAVRAAARRGRQPR